MNLAITTDSYKVSHWKQFPKNTKKLFYYFESRTRNSKIVFFGLQALILEYLLKVPSKQEINEAELFWKSHGLDCFNKEGWLEIAKLGYLPVEIKAVPEGMVLSGGNILFSIVNTDDRFYWLPGWLETLLVQVWYPTTVCTRSWEIKQIIKKHLEETGDDPTDFKLHDFGFRGVSSYQSAMFGGMAHLVNFKGTDTVAGIIGAKKYYLSEDMAGFSIPAMEHSTVTSWGKDGEEQAYENMIVTFKDNGIFAMVMDSYDIDNAIDNIIGKKLKKTIQDSGATVVFRPDSGDPAEMVIRVLNKLANIFGCKTNRKGFDVLNNVRIIQGDGISDPKVIDKVLTAVAESGFSADNVAFGMGGGLLQQVNRDTYKFAMKCSARFDGNKWHDVYKEPKNCSWKRSKRGLLGLSFDRDQNKYVTYKLKSLDDKDNLLKTVFKDGVLSVTFFDEIRVRARRK